MGWKNAPKRKYINTHNAYKPLPQNYQVRKVNGLPHSSLLSTSKQWLATVKPIKRQWLYGIASIPAFNRMLLAGLETWLTCNLSTRASHFAKLYRRIYETSNLKSYSTDKMIPLRSWLYMVTVTFFIQTFFKRNKVYTQQNLYKHYLYVTKFIREKVYTVTKFIHDKIYTVTKFIQTLFIR